MDTKKKRRRSTESVKMTITIPASLREQMSAYPEVNWSNLAGDAFAEKLGELAVRSEDMSFEEVAARLRLSKNRTYDVEHSTGVEDGKKWASRWARYGDLLELEQKFGKMLPSEWQQLASSGYGDTLLDSFLIVYQPKRYSDSEAARQDFAEGLVAQQDFELRDSLPYVMGFCAGALEIWARVKDQIG